MKVRIITGFAKGLEGEASDYGAPIKGKSVRITYPQGFDWMGVDLGGQTEDLFYYDEELEVIDAAGTNEG